MVNMRGSLIGLPTFGVQGSQGVNFAVATDTIQAFLGQPLATGTAPVTAVAAPPPPDPVHQTHNGPRTATQIRADLMAAGYGGPWDVNSMLAAYERANPCAGVPDAYRALQSAVQDAAKAAARSDYQALKALAANLRSRTYPQVLLPTVNAFLRMLDWQAPTAEIRFHWPLLIVVAARSFSGDVVLAAAQADLNRDDGEARVAETDFESALRQLAATCGA